MDILHGCIIGILSFTLVAIYRPLARVIGALDVPNKRSNHKLPTVRGAGIAFVATVLLVNFFYHPGIAVSIEYALLPAVVMALVGFIDDIKPLSAIFRLIVQATVAIACISYLPAITGAPWPIILLSIFFLMGNINSYNFMDGTNGLAAMQAITAFIAFALMFASIGNMTMVWHCQVLTAALVGFLIWNVPGLCFMGDVGSVFLGTTVGAMGLIAYNEGLPIPAILLASLLFYLDSGITLAKRAVQGKQLTCAHSEHLYQRLVHSLESHWLLLLLLTPLMLFNAGLAVLAASDPATGWTVLIIEALLIAILYRLMAKNRL